MDDMRFDAIAQTLSDGATRRTAFRLLSGGALAGVVGWLGLSEDGEAQAEEKAQEEDLSTLPERHAHVLPPRLQESRRPLRAARIPLLRRRGRWRRL